MLTFAVIGVANPRGVVAGVKNSDLLESRVPVFLLGSVRRNVSLGGLPLRGSYRVVGLLNALPRITGAQGSPRGWCFASHNCSVKKIDPPALSVFPSLIKKRVFFCCCFLLSFG